MTIALFGLLAFAVIFGGGVVGLIAGKLMPETYNDAATRTVVQTAMRTVSLLAALVLGLLVATAKNKFDSSNMQVERFASDLMALDRELANYGPEASDIRSLLRKYTAAKIAATWPSDSAPKPALDDPPPWRLIDAMQQQLRRLTPQSQEQRATLTGALQIAADLTKATWLQKAQESDHVPQPFVLILMAWLFILFVGFGIFGTRNALTVTALFVCALSIASAVALVDDLDSPFGGVVRVSAQPMQKALAQLGAP
jgi:hypothetical protein